MWTGAIYFLYIYTVLGFLYLVMNCFSHKEGGNMERQDILEEKSVDVLHGLHLLSFHLEAFVQQEVDAAAELILRDSERFYSRADKHICDAVLKKTCG